MSGTYVENSQSITAEGFERLQRELLALSGEGRRELVERLRDARSDGDVADNPALLDLLDEHAQLERRIALLESQLASVRVVTPARSGVADVGTHVAVRDTETGEVAEYQLVGAVEVDVGNGRVSVDAPVGRALLGAQKGDLVEVDVPRGTIRLEVLSVGAARKAA